MCVWNIVLIHYRGESLSDLYCVRLAHILYIKKEILESNQKQ